MVYGLEPGSSDLIGWRTVTITEQHLGGRLAVFTSIEVKQPGETVPGHQSNWIASVQRAGGIAGVARSTEDARRLLGISI